MAVPAAAVAAAKAGVARKLAPLIAVLVAFVLGLPLLFVFAGAMVFSQAEKQLTESACGTAAPAPNAKAQEIPDNLLAIYMAAGQHYGVDWRLLAGIGYVETDHGRNLAVSSAGALGPMQFMPDTWEAYGVDADGDGRKDPWTMADAVYGAANYLKALLDQERGDVRRAIFGYNHASWYVDQVLAAAHSYGYGANTGLDSPSSGCEGIGAGGLQAIRQAADQLDAMRVPYAYGGGHASAPARPDPGLDCSSSISWVLQHAGYDMPTMDTVAFQQWAEPGRGQDGVTLWNKPYGADAHIIIQVGDRFFGTSAFGHPSHGDGPAWFDEPPSAGYLAGFNALHIPDSAKPASVHNVALVGDSLGVGIEDRLPNLLGGRSVSTDDREGRRLAEGMDVIRGLGRMSGVLAVSLFTNDDPGAVGRLADAVRESTRYVADGGCVVWATIARAPVGDTSYERANTTLRSIAADNPQVIVVDWATQVRNHPGWLNSDDVHPTSAGYDAHARLYAEGIRRCLR